jgi:hypothetical protein
MKVKNEWWLTFIYIGFFGLIGFAIYYTESAIPLFALLLTPEYSTKGGSKKEEKDKGNDSKNCPL